jgi:hypothetical protein
MKTHDPFLRHLSGCVDRLCVWCTLAFAFTALAWAATWIRGLGLAPIDGLRVLASALTNRDTDRTALTLLALCILVGIATATLVSGWLFRRWQRRSELDLLRLRGARWENEQ